MIKKALLIFVVILLGTAAGLTLFETYRSKSRAARPHEEHHAAPQLNTPESKPLKQPVANARRAELQRIIQSAVDRLGPLDQEEKIDAFLQSLYERARAKGQASVLEVEPGLEAIRRAEPSMGTEKTMAKDLFALLNIIHMLQ